LDGNVQQILAPGQVKGRGFGPKPAALFQQIGDVLAGKRLELKGVFHGPGRGFDAVDFA